MRKIINGLIYDTSKASIVCVSKPKIDINLSTTIYRTNNGRFFKVVNDLGNFYNQHNLTPFDDSRELINWLEENKNSIDEDIESIIEMYFPDEVQEG